MSTNWKNWPKKTNFVLSAAEAFSILSLTIASSFASRTVSFRDNTEISLGMSIYEFVHFLVELHSECNHV